MKSSHPKKTGKTDKEESAERTQNGGGEPQPHDRVFLTSVGRISSNQEVQRAVEKAAQWACEVIKGQKLSGAQEGSEPDAPSSLSSPSSPEQDGACKDEKDEKDEKARQLGCAHDAFCSLVSLFRSAFEGRWAGALANNIEAMDLSDGQPEVASVLRHALEKACVMSRFRWNQPLRAPALLCMNGGASREASSSDALAIPALPAPPALTKAFWKAAAHRGRLNPRARVHAQVTLVSVSVQRGMNRIEDLGGAAPGRPGQAAHANHANHTDAADEPDVGSDELLMVHGGSRWLSMQLLARIKRGMGETGCAVVVVPRLFAHEEFSGLSMQLLNDIPLCIARALESSNDDADLASAVCSRLGIGALDDANVDASLVAQARMHYLLAIVYRQENVPEVSDAPAIEPQALTSLDGQDIWPNGLDDDDKRHFGSALNDICAAVTSGDVVLAPQNADAFFSALRDGIRRQRAQVLLENVAELLDDHHLAPEACYFEIAQDPLGSGLNFLVSNAWFEFIGDIPWTYLRFDSPEIQSEHLATLAGVVGFRKKSDVFLIKNTGLA